MPDKVRVLLVEDSEDDALLVLAQLRRDGLDVDWRRVDSEAAYLEALEPPPDVILCDYNLPGFDSFAALAGLQRLELDVPFIIVSGAIGEEVAVRAMKSGAHDYVHKGNLTRLAPAIEREIKEAAVRRERRLAEAALRDSEERFRALIEHSADGIAVLDAGARLVYFSPSAAHVFGYTFEEACRLDFPQAVHEDDLPKRAALFERVLSAPGETVIGELRVRHKDGSWRFIECTLRNLLHQPGVNGIVCNFRDVTARKEAERAALRAQAAEERDKYKTFLLSTVSHELRTPIAAIKGYATTLEDYGDRLSAEEWDSYLHGIVASSERLETLVEDLLLLANAEAQRLPLHLSELELLPFVEETVSAHARVHAGRRFDVDVGPHLKLRADASRLRQVFDNLIGNAIKYAPADSPIVISAQRQEEQVACSVRDFGPGVPEESLERIFEPFTRAVHAEKASIQGSGLGLAISRSIVQAHGGQIWAALPPDGGLCVTFTLPAPDA